MARCGCTSTTCSCAIKGGTGVVVTGKGSPGNEYFINIDAGKIAVDQTPTVHLALTGNGTSASYYHLSATATVALDELDDVVANNPAAGQVLAWDNVAKLWKPAPPAVAAPGTINVSNGLSGDGSAATPLLAKVNAAAGLQVDGNGIGLQSGVLAAINAVGTGWKTYDPVLKNVDSYTTAASSSPLGRYNVINKVCHAYGQITSTNAVDNIGVTLPLAATSRVLNLGTLGSYGTGEPSDQSGIARILSATHLGTIVVHAFSNGFRGVVKGGQLTWNVVYEVA